uniref:Putative secreted protein n=1 Tax=Ixodes ricinus TaxID=34613 RepID=A0A6B0UQZ3_IXORI
MHPTGLLGVVRFVLLLPLPLLPSPLLVILLLELHLGKPLCLGHPLHEDHHFLFARLVQGKLLANQVLNPLVQLHVILGHKGYSFPRPPRTRSSAHTVNVVLGVRRDVEVDHAVHVWNIQTSAGNIGGNQD